MPYEAKTNWKYDDTVTEKDLNRIEQGLKDAHVAEYKDITLQPGVQIVDVPEDTPFRMGEIRGRTLINLLGYAGACENTSLWSTNSVTAEKFTSEKVHGESSLKVTLGNIYEAGNAYRFIENTPSGKSYVVVGYIKNGSEAGTVRLEVLEYNGDQSLQFHLTRKVDSSDNLQPVHMAFTLSDQATRFAVHLAVFGKMNESYGLFDLIRVYEIPTSEVEKINAMTSEQVAAAYPYVDAMTNVTNPYTVANSKNMLPPFHEWKHGNTGIVQIVESYDLTIKSQTPFDWLDCGPIKALPNTVYRFDMDGNGIANYREYDAHGNNITDLWIGRGGNFTTKAETAFVSIAIMAGEANVEKSIRQPRLTPTVNAYPFEPQSSSLWATECQMAANPVDGSNPDLLFVGDDGLPYVLEKWKKVVLDGTLEYELFNSYTGGKCVRVKFNHSNADIRLYPYLIKYNGKVLPSGSPSRDTDVYSLLDWNNSQTTATDFLGVGIPNTDSGWGDNYEPSEAEIKAYFLGWTMYDGTKETYPAGNNLYNGLGSSSKWWVYRKEGSNSWAGATNECPTTMAPINSHWRPYRLQYHKAKQTVEPVRNYETGLSLSKGWNMVEVGSGIVIREKANPVYVDHYINGPSYYINGDTPMALSKLMHRPKEIISIVKNQGKDLWNIIGVAPEKIQIFGKNQAFIPAYNFDLTAVYHVTYTILDSTLLAPVNGSITTNLRGTVTDVVHWASDAERRLSVMENQKTEENVLEWISPTLINGWVNRNIGEDAPAGYLKDHQGFVHFRGIVFNETAGANNIFYLPEGFRPSCRLQFINLSANPSSGLITSYITIEVSGAVYFNAGAVTHWLSLDNISFLAEQ